MRSSNAPSLLFPLLLAAACGGSSDFGEPIRLQAGQRPTVWDAPARNRLRVREMAPARPTAAPRYAGTAPAGWREVPGDPARFRDLQWRVEGAEAVECYFTAGTGGGVVGNLQRWYRQFGQQAEPPDRLPQVPFAGEAGRLLELKGSYLGEKPGYGMLLVFKNRGDVVTTLKCVGPEAAVLDNRDEFLELAASIRLVGEAAAPPGDTPPGGAAAAPFTADVPEGWRAQSSGRLLHHAFGESGEVYVSAMGGTLRAYVDVFRQAMGQPAATDEEFAALPKCEMLGPDAVWLDVRGSYRGNDDMRSIVVLRADGAGITFVKMVGTEAEVEAEADALRAFCASLRRNS